MSREVVKKMQEKKLSPAAREARHAYLREWRKKNRDKIRDANLRYWEKKAKQSNQEKEEEKKHD